MLTREQIELFTSLLTGSLSLAQMPDSIYSLLLQVGAIKLLQEDPSESALDALATASFRASSVEIQSRALQALAELAAAGNDPSRQSLFRLAVEHQLLEAQKWIQQNHLDDCSNPVTAAYYLITGQASRLESTDPDLKLLTQYFLNSSEATRWRMIEKATHTGFENWASIVKAVHSESDESFLAVVSQFPSFRPIERMLAVELFTQLVEQGSQIAINALSQLYTRHEDIVAAEVIRSHKIRPKDPEELALLLFLLDDWSEYQRIDPNHSQIAGIYEKAGPELKKRILTRGRQAGQIEWLKALTGTYRPRSVADMTDLDWNLSLERLVSQKRFDEIWRLAQAAPPIWSLRFLRSLDNVSWQPQSDEESQHFSHLKNQSARLKEVFSELHPQRLGQASSGITCMDISEDGNRLAAGTFATDVLVFDISSGGEMLSHFYAPVDGATALALSRDASNLIVAGNDHILRIFRLPYGQLIKEIEGHSHTIRSLALHPNERMVYSAGFDGSIRSWRFPLGTAVKTLVQCPQEIYDMQLSSSGERLIFSTGAGSVEIWNTEQVSQLYSLKTSLPVTHLSLSQSGNFVAGYTPGGDIHVWNFKSGSELTQFCPTPKLGRPTVLEVLPNQPIIAIGTDQGQLGLFDIWTHALLCAFRVNRSGKRVTSLNASGAGDTLYVSTATGEIISYNLKVLHLIRTPLEVLASGNLTELQQHQNAAYVSGQEKEWLDFLLVCLKWRQRFDIQIELNHPIHIGEFDIEL